MSRPEERLSPMQAVGYANAAREPREGDAKCWLVWRHRDRQASVLVGVFAQEDTAKLAALSPFSDVWFSIEERTLIGSGPDGAKVAEEARRILA